MSQSNAERLVTEVRAMPHEELTERIREARRSTPAEIVEGQHAERCARAEDAAARFRAVCG